MHTLGHVGISLLVYAPIAAWHLDAGATVTAILGGVLMVTLAPVPDIDEYTDLLAHRGITHSVWFAGFVAIVVGGAAAIGAAIAPVPADPFAVALQFGALGGLAIVGHLMGDVITPMGLAPFAPLSAFHYTFDLTLSKEPRANHLFFGSGLLAIGAAILLAVS